MTKEESFLLLSLKESKAKKVAQAVSNPSCQKILGFLAKKDKATESDISKELSLPISTVHYNLKQLIEANLVKSDEYHYSQKGKEVNHYSLAKKYIIIAPDEDDSFLDKIKNLLPAFLILGITSLGIYFSKLFSHSTKSLMLTREASDVALKSVAMLEAQPECTLQSLNFPQIALWFFIGGVFALVVFLVANRFRKR